MSRATTIIGPEDAGRRMSLDEFDLAEGREGHVYELSRGVITVTDVPNRRHLAQVNALRRLIHQYDAAHPDFIHTIANGSDCKLLLENLESERHPDLAVYKTAPPTSEDFWARWIPELVVEVVSPSSVRRDYEEKPPEYLAFGIHEYWIVDADRREVTVLRRRGGRWAEQVIRPGAPYSVGVLPGFVFDCAPVFKAADAFPE